MSNDISQRIPCDCMLNVCLALLSVHFYFRSTSVFWRCCLGGRKGIRPVKTEWWAAGVVICLERDADLHVAQLMPLRLTVSCFSKIQIDFIFLVPAHLGSPGQRVVKRMYVLFQKFKFWNISLKYVYEFMCTESCFVDGGDSGRRWTGEARRPTSGVHAGIQSRGLS